MNTETTSTQQIALRRHAARLAAHKVTFDTISLDELTRVTKGVGMKGAAYLLNRDESTVRAKLNELRGGGDVDAAMRRVTRTSSGPRRTAITPLPRLSSNDAYTEQQGERMHALQTSVRREPPTPVVHDLSTLVMLSTLAEGARFYLPESARTGVLIKANDCRARVRFETAARSFVATRTDADGQEHDVELSFARSGEIDIAPRVLVVPLKEDA